MSFNIERYILDNVVLENEKILWRGRSEPDLSFKTIFSLSGPIKLTFWSLFAFLWGLISWGVIQTVFDGTGLIISAIIAAVPCGFTYLGIRLIYLSPRKKISKLQNTYYGITDRRVLIMGFHDKVEIVPIDLQDIDDYKREVWPDGKGSIKFKKKNSKNLLGLKSNEEFGLYYIADVSNAAKALQNVLT